MSRYVKGAVSLVVFFSIFGFQWTTVVVKKAGPSIPADTIEVIGVGTQGNADGANITPTIHASSTTGDLMIVIVHQRDRVATSVSGWTLKDTTAVSATSKMGIWWKIHDGDEANPTVTHASGSSICGYVLTLRGADATAPFDTLQPYTNQNSDPGPNTFTTAQLTTLTDTTAVFHIGGCEDNNTWDSQTGKCATLVVTYANASGTDNSIYICYGKQLAAGATGTSAITQNAWDNGQSTHFAIRND